MSRSLALLPAPVQRHAVAPAREHVAVQAVVGGVQRAAREPLVERRVVVVEHPRPRLEPVQLARPARPTTPAGPPPPARTPPGRSAARARGTGAGGAKRLDLQQRRQLLVELLRPCPRPVRCPLTVARRQPPRAALAPALARGADRRRLRRRRPGVSRRTRQRRGGPCPYLPDACMSAPRRPRHALRPPSTPAARRWAICRTNRMPIITIQKAGTICSSAPPIGRKIRIAVNMPRKPIQRGSSPTRIGVDHHRDHPRRERQPREQVEVVDERHSPCPSSAPVRPHGWRGRGRPRICASRSR